MAGKQWSPRRGRVTREELIDWVSRYYPDDAIARSYTPETGTANNDVLDGLAKFVVQEILDLFMFHGDDTDDEEQLEIVAHALGKASKELDRVAWGVEELLKQVKKDRKGKQE